MPRGYRGASRRSGSRVPLSARTRGWHPIAHRALGTTCRSISIGARLDASGRRSMPGLPTAWTCPQDLGNRLEPGHVRGVCGHPNSGTTEPMPHRSSNASVHGARHRSGDLPGRPAQAPRSGRRPPPGWRSCLGQLHPPLLGSARSSRATQNGPSGRRGLHNAVRDPTHDSTRSIQPSRDGAEYAG